MINKKRISDWLLNPPFEENYSEFAHYVPINPTKEDVELALSICDRLDKEAEFSVYPNPDGGIQFEFYKDDYNIHYYVKNNELFKSEMKKDKNSKWKVINNKINTRNKNNEN